MTRVIIIRPKETVLQSLIKDSYMLLAQLLFFCMSLRYNATGWAILAFLILAFGAVLVVNKRLKQQTFPSNAAAILHLQNSPQG